MVGVLEICGVWWGVVECVEVWWSVVGCGGVVFGSAVMGIL